MKVRSLFFALCLVLLFGCAGQEQPPVAPPNFEEYAPPVPPQEETLVELNGTIGLNETDIVQEEGLEGSLNSTFGNESYVEQNESGEGQNDTDNGGMNATGETNEKWMDIVFFDVGHGDATLLHSEDRTILIDTGPDGQAIRSKLKEVGVKTINLLIISSWDAEKTGGVREVLREFTVDEVWSSQEVPASFWFEEMQNYILRQEVNVHNPKAGQKFKYGNIELEVYNPQETEYLDYADANAIVIRASIGEFCAFFPSDLEHAMEASVVKWLDERTCAVYKWRNHGEARPEPSVLFDRISPSETIISVGKNELGFPSSTTIQRLGIARTGIYRTDLDGDIYVNATPDGDYRIYTQVEQSKPAKK